MFNKKGAIELSMTTIIIVIIGVVLLSLGLVWVRNVLNQTGDLTEESFRAAREAIQAGMTPDEDFYISGVSYEVKAGKTTYIYSGIRYFNEDADAIAKFRVTSSSHQDWFTFPPEIDMRAGDVEPLPIALKVPSNIPKGTTSVVIKAEINEGNSWGTYAQEVIIIDVI